MVKPSDCVIKWCFKSCPREGASLRLCRLDDARAVSSRAPVRGHQVTRKEEAGLNLFKIVPPAGGIEEKKIVKNI